MDAMTALLTAPARIADAATTGNITLSGAQTIDGQALVVGQYCLVWQQSTASQNGLYRVRASTWEKLGQPEIVIVRTGTRYDEKAFFLKSANTYRPIASGSDAVESVKAAGTSTSSTMDGIAIASGDKVLVISGGSAGIWEYDGSTFGFDRQATLVGVQQGTTYGRHVLMLTAANTYSLAYAVFGA